MILHDWFDWSNAGVGVVGLALTLWAVRQATGAKEAADEARQAVFRRNASDDVRKLERLASSLLTAIETGQYGLASHQTREFISDCLNVREHHRARLGTEGARLNLAFDCVREIYRGIHTGAKRTELVGSAQRVVGEMSSLTGTLSREAEEEES